MAVTQAEVLDLFSQVAAIKNSDQLLMLKANAGGTVTPTKITAELLRAYLNAGFAITIDGEGYLCIGGVRTETMATAAQMINHPSTDTNVSITPNVLHVWGEMTTLTIGLAIGATGQINEYMIQFQCPSNATTNLTLPTGIKWIEEPDLEPGNTYQVSILNNLAVIGAWEE